MGCLGRGSTFVNPTAASLGMGGNTGPHPALNSHFWFQESGGINAHRQRLICRTTCCQSAALRTSLSLHDGVCLFVGCSTSQQQASVSQGRIFSDNFTCCHTEIEVADQTFYLTQSQYTDTGPTSPSADPITPGAWQGSHWSANV